MRGYAILITVVAHLGPIMLSEHRHYLTYFWLGGGVDLFFCISGFVIAKGMLKEKRNEFLLIYIPFLIRRFFRLWPAAFFWTLMVLLLSIFLNQRGSFDSFENNFITAVSAWFNVVNFRMVSCLYLSYGDCSIVASPLRIYWSLSLEEQFYFVFPILLFFLGDRRLAILISIAAVIQFFLYRPWPSPTWFF